MAYIISIFRGDAPDSPQPLLGREELLCCLRESAHTRELKPGTWRFDDGTAVVDLSLPPQDPGGELQLKVRWSTADQLAASLEFATALASRLDARAYDRNGASFITAERVKWLKQQGGFAPARAPRRRWF
jgi:hypothetical protein